MKKDLRKESILSAALMLASNPGGWTKITRESVARNANCSEALVSNYFGTMTRFKRTIMRAAIKRRNLSIVAQGILSADLNALRACEYLRKDAIDFLKTL